MKKNSMFLILVVFIFIGCQDTRSMPEDMVGLFIYSDSSSTYYTMDILNRTSGDIYTMDDNGTPDDRTDDGIPTATDPFTISESGSSWHFVGGPLDNDVSFQLTHTINVYGFNGDNPAKFLWFMDD